MRKDRRLIVALDLPTSREALSLATQIGDAACFYKVGLELFSAGSAIELSRQLMDQGNEVFLDVKLLDIPTTVARAVRNLAKCKATYVTVHAQEDAMRAAVDSCGDTGVLAVTLLTSVSERQLAKDHAMGVGDYVVERASLAIEAGCAGVVCSPRETRRVREQIGPGPVIVNPGIRSRAAGDDQARVAGISQAIADGASHAVVGRQVRDAGNPREAVLDLLGQMGAV